MLLPKHPPTGSCFCGDGVWSTPLWSAAGVGGAEAALLLHAGSISDRQKGALEDGGPRSAPVRSLTQACAPDTTRTHVAPPRADSHPRLARELCSFDAHARRDPQLSEDTVMPTGRAARSTQLSSARSTSSSGAAVMAMAKAQKAKVAEKKQAEARRQEAGRDPTPEPASTRDDDQTPPTPEVREAPLPRPSPNPSPNDRLGARPLQPGHAHSGHAIRT